MTETTTAMESDQAAVQEFQLALLRRIEKAGIFGLWEPGNEDAVRLAAHLDYLAFRTIYDLEKPSQFPTVSPSTFRATLSSCTDTTNRPAEYSSGQTASPFDPEGPLLDVISRLIRDTWVCSLGFRPWPPFDDKGNLLPIEQAADVDSDACISFKTTSVDVDVWEG